MKLLTEFLFRVDMSYYKYEIPTGLLQAQAYMNSHRRSHLCGTETKWMESELRQEFNRRVL